MEIEDVPYLEQGPPSLATRLLTAPGRKRYLLEVEDGKITQLLATEHAAPTENSTMRNISMQDAAKRLRHSYSWLSRKWHILGLKPRRIGRVLFFRSDDIDALIERTGEPRERARARGRSKKIIGVLNATS